MIALDSATATISSVAVSAGLTSGTPVQVITLRGGFDPIYLAVWAIPAPSGTGTITVTLSASVPYQSNAILFSGADQTTPCPTGDAASQDASGSSSATCTPANLTANDAAAGLCGNAERGDAPAWGQTQTFNNNTSNVNMAAGYHLGTGAVTASWGSPPLSAVIAAARVVAATGGGAVFVPHQTYMAGILTQ
jgi:hypothetical protein